MSQQSADAFIGPPGRRDEWSLWRNTDFLLLWGGQIVSGLGSRVSALALPLLLLASTGSPLWAGILTGLGGLPFAVLSLPIGALVDRWDRKWMMVLSDLGRALTLGSVPILLVLGDLTLPALLAVVMIEGALDTFFVHARAAAIARVVRKEHLAGAIAREQATDALTGMAGPALGGFLYGLAASLPFAIDAVSFGASAISLLFLRQPLQESHPANKPVRGLGQLVTEIRDGIAWLVGRPSVRILALLTGGLNFFSFGYALIFILLAQRLGATPVEIGLLFGTTGLGSLAGASLSPALLRRCPVGLVIVTSGWVWAVTWPLYVLAPSVVWLGVVNILGLIVVPIYSGAQTTYRLGMIPDGYLGRVNSVFRLISNGLQPLGLALAGALIQVLGPTTTVWIITLPQVLLALVATCDPALRRARLMEE